LGKVIQVDTGNCYSELLQALEPVSRGAGTDKRGYAGAAFDESPHVDNLQTFFADTYEPTGPFGAKGIGEAAMNPVAAAYANAIADAIGVRFYELPITPERILDALEPKEAARGA